MLVAQSAGLIGAVVAVALLPAAVAGAVAVLASSVVRLVGLRHPPRSAPRLGALSWPSAWPSSSLRPSGSTSGERCEAGDHPPVRPRLAAGRRRARPLGWRTKSAELAAALGTTAGFVPQILGPLVERGWVDSVPGPTGGYESAVAPARGLGARRDRGRGGPDRHGRRVLVDRPCSDGGHCAMHQPWGRARAGLLDELGRTSLADLEVP